MRIPAQPPVREKEWTLLFYNAGHADESKMCTSSLLDLERVGSNDDTHVVVMNHRSPWFPERLLRVNQGHNGTRTYYVEKQGAPEPRWYHRYLPADARRLLSFFAASPGQVKSTEIEPARDDVNMGQAETLKRFLVDNMQRYPARHYAVVISGHGAAFAGQSIVHSPEGRIQNEDLGRVLREAQQETGRRIDLLNLNTCFGANLETLYPLRDAAQVAVASETTVFAGTQPFAAVLEDLQHALESGRPVTAGVLGKMFVDESHRQPMGGLYTETLSAVDLPAVGRVATAFKALQDTLINIDPMVINDAMKAAVRFDYSSVPRQVDLTDVGSFAREIAERVDDAKVRGAAEEVTSALKQCVIARSQPDVLRETVITRAARFGLGKADRDLSRAGGLTVYLDADIDGEGSRLAQLQKSDYAKDLQPEAFLRHASRPAEEARADRGALGRTLDRLAREHQKLDNRITRATHVPGALKLAERVGLGAGMLLGFRALAAAGIPAYSVGFGTYFAVRGATQVFNGIRDAVRQDAAVPVERQRLVSAVGQVALGAATSTFGLYLLGVLPPIVAWPAAIVAVGTRVGTELAKLFVVRHEREALLQGDEQIRRSLP